MQGSIKGSKTSTWVYQQVILHSIYDRGKMSKIDILNQVLSMHLQKILGVVDSGVRSMKLSTQPESLCEIRKNVSSSAHFRSKS